MTTFAKPEIMSFDVIIWVQDGNCKKNGSREFWYWCVLQYNQTCNICPSLIEIGSKTAEKNSAQTNRQTDRQTDKPTDTTKIMVTWP